MNPITDSDSIRAQFPCLGAPVHGRRLAWLDTASTALKPVCVIDAIRDYYVDSPANVHRGVHALSETATARFEVPTRAHGASVRASSGHSSPVAVTVTSARGNRETRVPGRTPSRRRAGA